METPSVNVRAHVIGEFIDVGSGESMDCFFVEANAECADAEADWDAELERRARAISDGTAKGRPAEEVFEELRKQFP